MAVCPRGKRTRERKRVPSQCITRQRCDSPMGPVIVDQILDRVEGSFVDQIVFGRVGVFGGRSNPAVLNFPVPPKGERVVTHEFPFEEERQGGENQPDASAGKVGQAKKHELSMND